MTNTEVYELLKEISDYCKGKDSCAGCDFKGETGCMLRGDHPDSWEVKDGDTE